MKLRRDCPVECQLCGLVEQGAVMEDRELLELAAKAAGIALEWPQDLGGADYLSPREKADWQLWNPLKNDGDALRLAVKLQLHVMEGIAQTPDGNMHVDKDMTDPYAATRRAIVRAAAALATARDA